MLTKEEVELRAKSKLVLREDRFNILISTDSYKITHYMQYPSDTKCLISYYESRGDGQDPYGNGSTDFTLWIGLQMYLKRYLSSQITHEDIDEAQIFWYLHFGFHYFDPQPWTDLVNDPEYNGYLPIKIYALPEGLIVKKRNALMQIVVDSPKYFWAGQFVESILSNQWKTVSVGTLAFEMWQLAYFFSNKTTLKEDIDLRFFLNDFGMRGVSCPEDGGLSGAAFLSVFDGSDNTDGIQYTMKYYNSGMSGFSVFATEHSTSSSRGEKGELEFYKHCLKIAPSAAVKSIVGDTYNYDRYLGYLNNELKPLILQQEGKVVARPDSGSPPHQSSKTLFSLWKGYGGTTNALGYKELYKKVGCIYGDSINKAMCREILTKLVVFDGFAIGTGNIIFGSGGGALQQFSRDTHKMAFKLCEITTESEGTYPVYKITGDKSSKQYGKLMVVLNDAGEHETIAYDESRKDEDQLVLVFENGKIVREWTWNEVKSNVQKAKDKYIAELEREK